MPAVFISGSRVISYIPDEALNRVNKMIEGRMDILIGDSERGVDARIAAYLYERQYDRVDIYTVRDAPRISKRCSTWGVVNVQRSVEPKRNAQGETVNQRSIETEKDRAMADRAEFGLVVWQPEYTNRFGRTSVSKGSLRNMYQLLRSGKPVVLYLHSAQSNAFEHVALKSLSDLTDVVTRLSSTVQRSYDAIAERETRASQQGLSF